MPQVVKGLNRDSIGIIGRMFTTNVSEDEDQALEPNLFQIDFDPSIQSDLPGHAGQSIYQPMFDEFEAVYEKVTGSDIQLGKGSRYNKIIDRDADNDSNSDISYYKQTVLDIANKNPEFRNLLTNTQKDKFANQWATNIFGFRDYLGKHLPPESSDEGIKMRKKGPEGENSIFDNIIDNAFNNYFSNAIKLDAQSTAAFHSIDSPGDWGEQMKAKAKMVIGAGAQANNDLLGTIGDALLTEAASGKGIASGFKTSTLGLRTEEFAHKVEKWGGLKEEEGRAQLEEAEPPHGRFAQSISERTGGGNWGWLKALSTFVTDPAYAAYKGSESALTSGGISAMGLTLGTAAQLHPAVKGASAIVRMGASIAASSPAMFAGYVVESGDAYSASRDALKKLQLDAKSARENMSKFEFEKAYTVWLGPNYSKTADNLDEKDIANIATEIAQAYGILATGVEATSTALQAGPMARFAGKALGLKIASQKGKVALGQHLTDKMAKNILKGGGAAKALGNTIFWEGLEEGVQEWLQTDIIERNIPMQKKDWGQIYDAMYAGVGMGLGIGGPSTIIGKGVQRLTEKSRIKAIEKSTLEAAKTKSENELNDTLDVHIKAGMMIWGDIDKVADELSSEGEEGNAMRKLIKDRFIKISDAVTALGANKYHLTSFLRKNKEMIESMPGLGLTEAKLRKLGILDDEQIAAILETDVSKLSKRETAAPSTTVLSEEEQKRVEEAAKESDAMAGVHSEVDTYDPDANLTKEPTEDYDPDAGDLDPTIGANYDPEHSMNLNDLDLINEEIKELEQTSLSNLGLTREEKDIKVENLKELKKKIEGKLKKTKPAVKDSSKDTNVAARKKAMNAAKHIGHKAFTEEEKKILKGLEKPDLTREELNKINRIIADRTKEVKKGVSKRTGLKKGDRVVLSSQLQQDKFKGKSAVILSINQNDAFILVDSGQVDEKGNPVTHKANMPYEHIRKAGVIKTGTRQVVDRERLGADLDKNRTVTQLKKELKAIGFTGYSGMRKPELIESYLDEVEQKLEEDPTFLSEQYILEEKTEISQKVEEPKTEKDNVGVTLIKSELEKAKDVVEFYNERIKEMGSKAVTQENTKVLEGFKEQREHFRGRVKNLERELEEFTEETKTEEVDKAYHSSVTKHATFTLVEVLKLEGKYNEALDVLDVLERKGEGSHNQIESERKGIKEKIAELVPEPKKQSMAESASNVAINIVTKAGDIVKGDIAYDVEVLDNMSDEQLIDHAKSLVIPIDEFINEETFTGKLDRSSLIQLILDAQGNKEFHGGLFAIPFLKRSNRQELHRLFRQGWYQTIQYSLGMDGTRFQEWVNYVGVRLPSDLQSYFFDWANEFRSDTTKLDEIARDFIDKVLGKPKLMAELHDQDDPEVAFAQSVDFFNERIAQEQSEGADISAENYNHLNTMFFAAMGITVKSSTMSEVVELAKALDSYEDWVREISRSEYYLVNKDGATPYEILNSNKPLARKLKQFYVSNLTENNVRTNDGILKEGESSRRKRVNYQLVRRNDGTWGAFTVKVPETKGRKNPSTGRATMADRFLELPLIWLNGSDVTEFKYKRDMDGNIVKLDNGKPWVSRVPVYGFLTSEQISELTRSKLAHLDIVPVFIRGDADKIAMIKITPEQSSLATDHVKYWDEQVSQGNVSRKTADHYMGKGLTDEQMAEIYMTPLKYRASGIARHEAYVKMFGRDYDQLSAHEIMHRIKIMFTPTLTRTGARTKSTMIVNLDPSLDLVNKGKESQLRTVTHYKDGGQKTKPLVKIINGKAQYVGDGNTIASEQLMVEDYPDEIGTNPTAKRAKTVEVMMSEDGVLLKKHQEMVYDLDDNAAMVEIWDGSNKIAEIRRESKTKRGPKYVNIYTDHNFDGKRTGVYDNYLDKLSTSDKSRGLGETKVMLGEFSEYQKVYNLPSEATGHIQITEGDKQKAPFPSQVANYITDPAFKDAIKELIDDDSNPYSSKRILDHIFHLARNPAHFDQFIAQIKRSFPDALPRMIEELAALGAGLHPSQLDYGSMLVKNKLLSEAMDLKQDGSVLDFRPNYTDEIDKGHIVLPFGHNIKQTILKKLAEQIDKDYTSLLHYSMDEINDILKLSPVKILLVRHPVPSRAGYRILTVKEFASGMGDSFKINDEDVKEVYEGDHDHDSGHVMILPDKLTRIMEDNQVDLGGLNLDEYASGRVDESIGSLSDVLNLMGEMSFGKNAIGEIANVQRIAGIAQSVFGSMEIEGKTIKVKSLDSTIKDPLGNDKTVEEVLRIYAQAAFDNVKERLLKSWGYTPQHLYRQLFYNTDGSEITDVQFQVLNQSFIRTLKMTQAVKNLQHAGNKLKFHEVLGLSERYKLFTEDRESYLYNMLDGEMIKVTNKEGEVANVKASVYVGDIVMSPDLHPHEKMTISPKISMDASGITIDQAFKMSSIESKAAHNIAHQEVSEEESRLERFAIGYSMDTMQMKSFDMLTDEDQAAILKSVASGEDWGRAMRGAMNDVYKLIEVSKETGAETQKVNSQSWDYNADFVEFTEKWLDGFDVEGEHQRGYNELSEVERLAATYAFLEGVVDASARRTKYDVRKVPPVSTKEGDSLLHPNIMRDYFESYNNALEDFYKDDSKAMAAKLGKLTIHLPASSLRTLKRAFGCE
jgi:hypothetical protein